MKGAGRAGRATEAQSRRVDAANSRTLAARISDEQGRQKLERIAVEFDRQADELEAEEIARRAAKALALQQKLSLAE